MPKKIRDKKRRLAWAAKAKKVCFLCGKPQAGFGFWFEIAHIIGGSGRSDIEENLTIQHHSCHASTHGVREIINGVRTPAYTRLDVLRGKLKYDPENWNPQRLEELFGRKILELEQL